MPRRASIRCEIWVEVVAYTRIPESQLMREHINKYHLGYFPTMKKADLAGRRYGPKFSNRETAKTEERPANRPGYTVKEVYVVTSSQEPGTGKLVEATKEVRLVQ